jgi:hypothetical protein
VGGVHEHGHSRVEGFVKSGNTLRAGFFSAFDGHTGPS